ncbi:CheC, inhibitor of MCP methylation [Methanosalsum zhilinae DSM 4017]|uniref:CheC, inhibitor of MCP methylation n=1 Tax=Methanosalsum zhilinae (strain DSM 4017 / NBRC 107636 / OCM 62 / WeN5) TaxID=679901 RepID=F7XQE4_METZD|nr:chemotaxis protein CheC [Methanosalsum zhilinae]AEH60445.1 CheC, inhibitor of MCP methylation [Methanosalsum zhilinae DSM 4017]
MTELDELTKGALQEAGNIGMGHLATSLSKIVNRDVKIDVPRVELLSMQDILGNESDEKNKSVAGIHLQITGDAAGGLLILLPKYSALSFSDLLMKKPIGTTTKVEEMHQKKLEEMGLRLCKAYMKAVNEFIGIELNVGKPVVEVNMAGVDDFITRQIEDLADEFIVVKNECFIPSTNSRHEFNMLFEPDAAEIIMTAVMKKMMG